MKNRKEDQSRNGVRVIVRKVSGGSIVESSCSCFGHKTRVHNNHGCPVFKKAVEALSTET